MRRRGRPKHPDILTPREWEVLALLRERKTNEQVAEALGVSLATARYHVSEILGKLGVSSREEAAAWQPPPERRSWLLAQLGLLRRTTMLGTAARIAAGGVVALAAAGIALLAWGVFRTSGHAAPRADDRIAPERGIPDATALVAINQDSGAITVLDPSTLAERGEIQAGYRPWVAVRQTAHQLLVAQAFGPGPTVTTPTLRIYDLNHLSSPPGIIPMPDRAVSTILAPEWFLTDDERYLYYGRVVPPPPGCIDDVYVCQHVSVGIIDLATREVAANISLPSSCTYPELRETAGGVLSMCLTQASSSVELTRVSSGAASLVATLALEDGPQGPATVAPVDAAQDARGDYYVVYQDGVLKSSAPPLDGLSFSSAERITVVSARLMPGGKRLLAYSTSIGVGQVNGVIVYDEHDPRQYRKIPVEGTWSDATPLSANRVALLRDGTVRVLDLDSGALLPQSGHVSGGEEFLAAG